MTEPLEFRTVIKFTALGIGIMIIMVYIAFQSRFLIIGPQIVLTNQPELLQNQRQIFLTGIAHNISHLWLNDRPIFTNAQGSFNESLVLENGYTMATLRAEDRYGRETKVTQEFVYAPVSFIKQNNE